MIFGILVAFLVVVSVLFVILPVLRQPTDQDSVGRDQQNIAIARDKKQVLDQQLADDQMTEEEYQAAMQDLETSLAIDLERQHSLRANRDAGRWAIWLFVATIPALSFYTYWHLGSYQVIENPALAQARTQSADPHASGGQAPSIEELIERVKNHLRDNPEDERGWFMLGRTYLSLQQYDKAVTALQRSYDLSSTEPAVMLALADAIAMTRDGDMSGQAEQLVKQALDIVPSDPTALWLAGLAAEQANRNREAWDHWSKLLPLLQEDPQSTAEVRSLLAALKQKQPDLPDLDVPAAATAAQVSLSIALDNSLAQQAAPDDLVFIYAKAASGPPMPLAARRMKVSDLPAQVTLGDDDAMMPQMKLSGFDQVVVGARISKTGNPIAQAGDLFAESAPLDYRAFTGVVDLRINQVKQ